MLFTSVIILNSLNQRSLSKNILPGENPTNSINRLTSGKIMKNLSQHPKAFLTDDCLNKQAIIMHYILKAQEMGNANATGRSTSLRHSHKEVQKVDKLYQSRRLSSCRKDNDKFKTEIDAIVRRCQYLTYSWAKSLMSHLKETPETQLYDHYESVLKQNCRRQGKRQNIFCANQIRPNFLNNFMKKYGNQDLILCEDELIKIFQQSKCYFMVVGWLHRMVSFNNNGDHCTQNQECNDGVVYLQEDQPIFQKLIILSKNAYQGMFGICYTLNKRNLIGRELQIVLDERILKIVQRLNKKGHFLEKQILIERLQTLLQNDRDNLSIILPALQNQLGKSVIFGYLNTIRQFGSVNIQYLWGQLYSNRRQFKF